MRAGQEVRAYFEYLPTLLKEALAFFSGFCRISVQYSSRTSSSISTVVE
jgi:hypothetical protein